MKYLLGVILLVALAGSSSVQAAPDHDSSSMTTSKKSKPKKPKKHAKSREIRGYHAGHEVMNPVWDPLASEESALTIANDTDDLQKTKNTNSNIRKRKPKKPKRSESFAREGGAPPPRPPAGR
jgi:hypothetical protein